jgi:hypothetical protein
MQRRLTQRKCCRGTANLHNGPLWPQQQLTPSRHTLFRSLLCMPSMDFQVHPLSNNVSASGKTAPHPPNPHPHSHSPNPASHWHYPGPLTLSQPRQPLALMQRVVLVYRYTAKSEADLNHYLTVDRPAMSADFAAHCPPGVLLERRTYTPLRSWP